MKKTLLTLTVLLTVVSGFSQKSENKLDGFILGAQYNHEFVLGGYVRVREWELPGDKMMLKDLGMDNYSAVQVSVMKRLKRNNSIAVTYDHYFMRGSATFDRDIAYNGTLINGRNGIDVSPTRYYRISASYRGMMLDKPHLGLQYMVGLVYDHIVFYLDGDVSVYSPRNEVYEGFGKQALPYPVVGLGGYYDFSDAGKLKIEVSGTYIPEFKSFYTESGRMYLEYSTFLTDLNYSRIIKDFEISVGGKLRYMHLFQESREDTNDISTFTAGPYAGVVYHF